MTASQIRPCCLRVSSPYKHHCLLGLWLIASCSHTMGPGKRAGKLAARPLTQGYHSTARPWGLSQPWAWDFHLQPRRHEGRENPLKSLRGT